MLTEGQHINVNCCISYDSNRPILTSTSQLSHISQVYLTLSIQFIILKRCSQPRASANISCDIHFLLIYDKMLHTISPELDAATKQKILLPALKFHLYWNVALNLELHQTNPVIFTPCSFVMKCHSQSLELDTATKWNFSLLALKFLVQLYWNLTINLELHQTNPVMITSCSFLR